MQQLVNRSTSKFTAMYFALAAAMFSPFAMAAGESGSIIAVFNEYKTEAVLIVIAFAVVLWTLRGTGLLKPR